MNPITRRAAFVGLVGGVAAGVLSPAVAAAPLTEKQVADYLRTYAGESFPLQMASRELLQNERLEAQWDAGIFAEPCPPIRAVAAPDPIAEENQRQMSAALESIRPEHRAATVAILKALSKPGTLDTSRVCWIVWKDAAEPEPPIDTTENSFTEPTYAAEVSEVEQDLLKFLQSGTTPAFFWDTERGRADAQAEGIAPEEIERERQQWHQAHAAQAQRLRAYLEGFA